MVNDALKGTLPRGQLTFASLSLRPCFPLHFGISESRRCLIINVSFRHIVLFFLFLKKATTELMMSLQLLVSLD